MRRLLLPIALAASACREKPDVIDRGGRSLDVPVPSSGVAATASASESDNSARPGRARQDPSKLDLRTDARGTYLVDASGRSLYTFSGDGPNQAACFTNCSAVWPPVIVTSPPAVSNPAIDATKLATITLPDGSRQLTYAARPLYYSESDRGPGDTWGHYAMSFGGRFALVAPSGAPLPPPLSP